MIREKTGDQRNNPATNEKNLRSANETRDPRHLDYLMESNQFIHL